MRVVLDTGAYMPTRAHEADAGLDLRTPFEVIIAPHGSAVIDTGVHMEIPLGCFGKIESKSGLNVNHNIVSCGGVIDSEYTGSICVKLYNLGHMAYRFPKGAKVAQIIIQPCLSPEMVRVDKLTETERGANGFGSTGI